MFAGLFGGFKALKWALVIGIIGLIAFLGYEYHKSMNGRITDLINQNQTLVQNNATLESNNTALKDGIATANATVDHLQETYEQIKQDYQNLSNEFVVIRSQNNELRERLGRHDLGALATAKPALVEKTINNATANALRCFELLTGAPLNEKEKAATTDRQFNSECPWMFNQ